MEDAPYLTRPHHLDVELGEDLRVLLQRLGGCEARLHVLTNGGNDLLELRVLRLFREYVEGADDGQAGVDHGRELPVEDDEVARLDLLERFQEVLLGHTLLSDVDDEEAPLAQLRGDGHLI